MEHLQIIVEAALVGSVADWFAVTALFKKPLNFPYHTELLPRKKDAFIDGTQKILYENFLHRRKLHTKIKSMDLSSLIEKVDTKKLASYLTKASLVFLIKYISSYDFKVHSEKIIRHIKDKVDAGKMDYLFYDFKEFLKGEKGSSLSLDLILKYLSYYLNKKNRAEKLAKYIDDYAQKHHGGMALSMAYMTGAFNPEDLGEVITAKGKAFIENCQNKEDDYYQQLNIILSNLSNEYFSIEENENNFIYENRKLANKIITSQELEDFLNYLWTEFKNTLVSYEKEGKLDAEKLEEAPLLKEIYYYLYDFIFRYIEELKTEGKGQKALENLLKTSTLRLILSSRAWLLSLAKNFLNNLSKEDLNNLIYPKVREDLIWIRLNGAIVGSILGTIYVLGQFIYHYFI